MNLITLFQNESSYIHFAPGEFIFREGEPGQHMYVLIEGSVLLSVRGIGIEILNPGELFGEMALIDDEPRSATAVARSPCRLCMVDERRFSFLVQETPFFALHVMRVLARRLRRMDKTVQ
jgi:CRP/FNR family transcriptional regulator, cyclic AMP receptor protein